MEGLRLFKDALQDVDNLIKIGLKDTNFSVPLAMKTESIFTSFEKAVYSFFALFWPWICSSDIHETIKNTNCITSKVEYSSDYITERQNTGLLLIWAGIFSEFKKLAAEPSKRMKFLMGIIDSEKMKISLPQTKLLKLLHNSLTFTPTGRDFLSSNVSLEH